MAGPAKNLMLLLMSEKCYDNYFEDFNFFDGKIDYANKFAYTYQ